MAGSASGAIESLAVVDYDVVDGNSKFTLFVVEVRVGAETHLVHRRYSEFKAFSEALRRAAPNCPCPSCPGKRRLGSNFDPAFLERRRSGLHSFVQQICEVSELRRHALVSEFFLRQFMAAAGGPEQGALDRRPSRSSSRASSRSSTPAVAAAQSPPPPPELSGATILENQLLEQAEALLINCGD